MMQSIRKRRTAVALAAMCVAMGAQAMEFDTGNEDLTVRWDNTVRYNLGVRAERMNADAYNDPTYDESDSKFGRGDVVTNRLDLLSELDVVYQRKMGFRVSGSAWYDQAYHNTNAQGNPAFMGMGQNLYPNGEYTNYTKRWNKGLSGEFLDYFVFANGDIGEVPVGVKVGSHNVYWGESLFSFVHGVSYSQGPVDVRKAFTNPGVEAKELFLPLTQISGQAQLAPNFSVAGQYLFDWKPSRIPDGGTYLGLGDMFSAGGGTWALNPAADAVFGVTGAGIGIPFAGAPRSPKKTGDWGVKATWRPDFLDGTLGFYYREYTDKLPQIVGGITAAGPDARFAYLPDNKLFGVSLSKEVAGVSVGAELTYRKNTGLLMNGAAMVNELPIDLLGVPANGDTIPRGNTLHALVNALYILPHNDLWDSGSFAAELTYSRLQKVTANPASYNGIGYGCASGNKWDGCATKDAWGIAMKFEPTWYQAVSGVDLSMPIVYQVGLKGNSPVLFGGYQGNGSYSIGLSADVQGKYKVALNYNDYLIKYKMNGSTLVPNGIGYIGDRGWVSLTVKASF